MILEPQSENWSRKMALFVIFFYCLPVCPVFHKVAELLNISKLLWIAHKKKWIWYFHVIGHRVLHFGLHKYNIICNLMVITVILILVLLLNHEESIYNINYSLLAWIGSHTSGPTHWHEKLSVKICFTKITIYLNLVVHLVCLVHRQILWSC